MRKSQKLESKCWTPKSKNWWENPHLNSLDKLLITFAFAEQHFRTKGPGTTALEPDLRPRRREFCTCLLSPRSHGDRGPLSQSERGNAIHLQQQSREQRQGVVSPTFSHAQKPGLSFSIQAPTCMVLKPRKASPNQLPQALESGVIQYKLTLLLETAQSSPSPGQGSRPGLLLSAAADTCQL